MKICITGSSGLIGGALVHSLSHQNHEIIKLVRAREVIEKDEIIWDASKGVLDIEQLENCDAVIHLAGESIMGRWSEDKKKLIYQSRIDSTRSLSRQLALLKNPPSVFIVASAVGYYGDRASEILTESSAKGSGFLSDVCADWESACQEAEKTGIRTVHTRFGIVLSPKGGALKQMLLPFKCFLGGCLGTGEQYMSWISLEDLIRALIFCLNHQAIKGAVNIVSPFPVTNRIFTKTLAHVLRRPALFDVPSWVIRKLLGEMGQELLLASCRVLPKKLTESGFHFEYEYLDDALKEMLH